jgi:tetratricopeptide (TPR) repeat protein
MTRTSSIAFALLLLVPIAATAQRPALKRGLPTVVDRPSCPAPPAPKQATEQQRRAARDLAQRAQQSAILGDRPAARDQLQQAVALDPASPDLAYQLARAQEAAGASNEAKSEYCRFVALAPSAPEAVEARERIASFSKSVQTATSDRIASPFRNGIAAYEAGRIAQAEGLFTAAIGLQPDWAEAYFNRAQTYAVRGQREQAIRDFQQYLRLKPEADDRGTVISRINALRGGPLSPATALTFGLVIPGAGQMYTGRTLFGLFTLGAASTAVAYALKSDPVTESYEATGELPFGGGTYTYPATRTVLGHPHRVVGYAGLGAIGITSAIEAYIYARHLNAREGRVSAAVVPAADGIALRLSLR